MGWLRNFRINRAAKRYAAELPYALHGIYGEQAYYTSCQIRTAIAAAELNRDFIALAYAGFLPEERFHLMAEEMRVPMTYEEARALMARHAPPKPAEN